MRKLHFFVRILVINEKPDFALEKLFFVNEKLLYLQLRKGKIEMRNYCICNLDNQK